ncbi:MAG: helix-turn-helix domain-containing protein [Candidatus Woesearchaeota archaeon]
MGLIDRIRSGLESRQQKFKQGSVETLLMTIDVGFSEVQEYYRHSPELCSSDLGSLEKRFVGSISLDDLVDQVICLEVSTHVQEGSEYDLRTESQEESVFKKYSASVEASRAGNLQKITKVRDLRLKALDACSLDQYSDVMENMRLYVTEVGKTDINYLQRVASTLRRISGVFAAEKTEGARRLQFRTLYNQGKAKLEQLLSFDRDLKYAGRIDESLMDRIVFKQRHNAYAFSTEKQLESKVIGDPVSYMLEEYVAGESTVAEIAKNIGKSKSTVYRWLNKYLDPVLEGTRYEGRKARRRDREALEFAYKKLNANVIGVANWPVNVGAYAGGCESL